MVIYGHMKAKSLLSTKNITPPPKKKKKHRQTNKQKRNKKTKEKENTSLKKCSSLVHKYRIII